MKIKNLIAGILIMSCIPGITQKINTDSLRNVVSLNVKDTNTVVAYRMLAGLVVHQDQQEALEFARKGVELGKEISWNKGIAGCYLNISVAYGFAAKFDSSLIFQDSALIYAYKEKEPKRLALIYLNKADIYMQLRIFDKALQYCDSSSVYAEIANNDDRKARIFQTIGSIYYYQELYDKSVEYYNKALVLYNKINNMAMASIVINNLANIYKHQKNYDLALKNLFSAINIGDSINDLNNMSMYHGNIGDVYMEQNKYTEAERYYSMGLKFALGQRDSNDIARNYSQLADVNLSLNKPELSIPFATNAYNIAKRNLYNEHIASSSNILSRAYYKKGDYKMAFDFLEKNRIVNDTLNKQQFNADIIAMQTRFDVTQKEKTIQLLNENAAIQEQLIKRKNSLNYILIAGFILLAISAFTIYNRYTLKQQLKEFQLRNSIAADLHDDIGSTLSSIRMYSDIVNEKIKEQHPDASSLLSIMSESSREMIDNMSDIVWAIKPSNDSFENIADRMFNFASGLCNTHKIELQMPVFKELENIKIGMEERRDLYLIFKEALNNAVKYATATQININFSRSKDILLMSIKDNGIGFDPDSKRDRSGGNGLKNMKERAALHNWKLNINSAADKGTEIKLFIHNI